jgi:hypothetical protein
VNQNQIEWHPADGGKVERSVKLPDPILSVTQMDRELYIRRFPVEQQPAARSMVSFAIFKPPFERVLMAPDLRLWLFKSSVALDSVRSFQVVSREDGFRQVVNVPSRGDALAISGNHLLMGEQFPGGVRLLQFSLKGDLVKPEQP